MNRRVTQPADRPRGLRKGAAAVEAALVLPLLIFVVLGIVEFGHLIMVHQVVTNACREGAREAVIETASTSTVQAKVSNYLNAHGITGAAVSVNPDPAASNDGDTITVNVSVGYDALNVLGTPFYTGGHVINATSIMRHEVLP